MTEYLNVYKDNRIIGVLRENTYGQLVFSYEQSWIELPNAEPLTEYLPLQSGDMSGQSVDSFFSNLLPEGDVLRLLSKSMHISPDNVFGWLSEIAGDIAGSCYVLPTNVSPLDARYLQITSEQFREWVESMKSRPLILNAKGARISLSGAQDKTSVMIRDNKLFIPIGAAPSTHILKPRIAGRSEIQHSAVNEAFVMMLGKAVGLGVANVEYRGDLLSLLVERYDRRIVGQNIERLHQLDFCQMLNLPSSKKYEAEGGPSIKDCFEVVRVHSSFPAADIKRLIGWVAFNVVVGNMDGHAKNLSVVYDRGRKALAPFYDIMCTSIYKDLNQKLAFRIGGESRPKWLVKRHWEGLANELSMRSNFVKKIVLDTINKAETEVPGILDKMPPLIDDREKMFLEDVTKSILGNAKIIRENMHREAPGSSGGEPT